MKKKLSIIIPCYNAGNYLTRLLDKLAIQITKEVEVIVIDDGSFVEVQTEYEWVKVIRQNNEGVSSARNTGLDCASGEYVSFIDADDNVASNYIPTILEKIKSEEFDYMNLSWKSEPNVWEVKLNSINDEFPIYNRSVWNRVFKRSIIGKTRFNVRKSFGEDEEFLRKVIKDDMKKSFVSDFMYFYSTNISDSLTKRFFDGRLRTRRVVYYFPMVTEKMTFLIDEFKELDKSAEIILMTNLNKIPQLEKYALIMSPVKIRGTELRGYPTNLFQKIIMPISADIVIWTEKTYEIGGIETFNYNFCKQMSKYYNIVVLYNVINEKQKLRLSEFARVIKNDIKTHIECKTLIVNRITDEAPANVHFAKKVQMVHSCKWDKRLVTPKDNDYLIAVSDTVAKTYEDFKEDYKVIQNMTIEKKKDKALLIVSATRTGTNEKGQKRMIALSNLLSRKGIPFIWYCFSDNPIHGANNICFLKPTLDISPYIRSADYLAQLSDHEGFCYSIVEAMELGVPILVTDLPVLKELGYEDGVTGYTIPWEITDDFDVEKIYNHQLKDTFEYSHDNDDIVKQWIEILGEGSPIVNLSIKEKELKLKALLTFDDMITHTRISKGDIIYRSSTRAYDLMQKKFVSLEE